MAEAPLNLLVIEDVEADFLLLERTLRKQLACFRSRRVASSHELEAALARRRGTSSSPTTPCPEWISAAASS